MKSRKTSVFLFLSLIITIFSSLACLGSSSLSLGGFGSSLKAPLYKNADVINLSENDVENLKLNFIGHDKTLYSNKIDIRVTDDPKSVAYEKIEEALINGNWRYEYALFNEVWRNGDHYLYLFYF